ncbi:MAG: glycosyltransferase family 2 protein [Phycisphaeraceae bacterium]|nr:glycosyltransferase family 2 protein [Phycisphaerales bacterium]MCB9844195.1 glycosyltransferase family 2 protein [Phycisphaeraceae bacterium]
MPRADVIIPTYNAGPLLRRAVGSALALPLVERVIVVDDGSDSPPELDPDPRLTVMRQPNAGPAAARNTGIDASTADWIIFCDADDALLPAIADSLALAEKHRSAACVSGRVEVFPDHSRHDRPAPEDWTGKPLASPGLIFKPIALFGTPGLIISRHAINKSGGGVRFDPTLHHGEDRDFIRRVAEVGPVAVSPALAVEYTKHLSDADNLNAPRHMERRVRNFLTILERHYDAESGPYFRESALWLLNASSKARVSDATWRALTDVFHDRKWKIPLKPRLRRLLRRPPRAA